MTHHPESHLMGICRRSVATEVRARAGWNLLDWLGCILAANQQEVAHALGRAIVPGSPSLLSSSFDTTRTDAQTAALLTGSLGNVLEMDDLHRASILHAGDTICAAALAVGLRRDVTGGDLLDAIVRGYEVGCRIGESAASGGYTSFYNSGTCGVFGAAIAASDLHGLDGMSMLDALGQAGMQASGIWQCRLEPGFSKQLACGNAARAGVLSAELAGAGFPGPHHILTGDLGFFRSYYPNADLAPLTRQTEDGWAISDVSFKPYPACRHTHPAISAALTIRDATASDRIEDIEIATYGAAIEFCDNLDPQSPDEARFSLQHAVALALLKGPPSISDFEGVALGDEDIRAMRHCVRLTRDEGIEAAFPRKFGARVSVSIREGEAVSATCLDAWGDPENPMAATDLVAKFHANCEYGGVGRQAADTLADAVLSLPDAPDLAALQHALTSAFGATKGTS